MIVFPRPHVQRLLALIDRMQRMGVPTVQTRGGRKPASVLGCLQVCELTMLLVLVVVGRADRGGGGLW